MTAEKLERSAAAKQPYIKEVLHVCTMGFHNLCSSGTWVGDVAVPLLIFCTARMVRSMESCLNRRAVSRPESGTATPCAQIFLRHSPSLSTYKPGTLHFLTDCLAAASALYPLLGSNLCGTCLHTRNSTETQVHSWT